MTGFTRGWVESVRWHWSSRQRGRRRAWETEAADAGAQARADRVPLFRSQSCLKVETERER